MSFKFFLILASMGRKRKKEEMKCRMTERGWHLTDCLSITRYFSDCLHVPSSDGRVLWNNQKGKNKKKRTAAKSNITSISCWFRRGGNAVSTPESLSPRLPIQALEYTRSFLSFFLSFFLSSSFASLFSLLLDATRVSSSYGCSSSRPLWVVFARWIVNGTIEFRMKILTLWGLIPHAWKRKQVKALVEQTKLGRRRRLRLSSAAEIDRTFWLWNQGGCVTHAIPHFRQTFEIWDQVCSEITPAKHDCRRGPASARYK